MIEPSTLSINIKENLRVFFLEEVIGGIEKLKEDGRMRDSILILDHKTTKVIDKFLNLIDIVEFGIVSIENLYVKRRPFKQFHAIYFVEPTEDSVRRIIDDFSDDTPEERDRNGKVVIPGGALYDFAHFIFSSRVHSTILETLSKSKNVVYATLSIRQINLDILTIDDCVFTIPCENEKVFLNAQITEKNNTFNDLQLLNDRAISIFTLIRKIENVQIIYQLGGASEIFAKEFSKRTSALVNEVERISKAEITPIFFFVLNRGSDLLSLFSRDNSYSSNYFDLLRKNDLKIELNVEAENNEKAKKIISKLDENDGIWANFKNEPFQHAYRTVSEKMKQFLSDYAKAKDTVDIEDQVRNLPIYKEFINDFSKHMNAMKSISDKIKAQKIKDLIEIEQGLLTGVKKNGQKFDIGSIKLLPEFEDFDRLRLALIGYYSGKYTKDSAILTFFENDEDLKDSFMEMTEIYDKARINPTDKLNWNEVLDDKTEIYSQPKIIDYFFNLLKNSFWDNPDIGPKFGKFDIYPKNATIKIFEQFQFKQTGILSNKDTLPVVVIFIIGGITNSEVVALKKMAERKDLADVKLILGGTSFNTPWWVLKKFFPDESGDDRKVEEKSNKVESQKSKEKVDTPKDVVNIES